MTLHWPQHWQESMGAAPTIEDKRELLALLREKERRRREDRLKYYRPYARQAEFHALMQREAALIAANQVGKTWCAASELAIHLTGRYPDWWQGRRWTRPIVAIVGSKSGQLTRDGAQRVLCGRPGEWGTGTIPKACIVGEPKRAMGTPDLLDSVLVRNVGGWINRVNIKTYDQGRERWQAETVEEIWLDEEPPEDIYFEALTRTNATGGFVRLTLTPLLGMSTVVRRYLMEPNEDRASITMTIDDAEHYTPEERAKIIASYPPHELEARAKGIPTLGSGRALPVSDAEITWEPRAIPAHWPQIIGIDFGWDHPTAAVNLAWDRDADCVYVTAAYRKAQTGVIENAAAIRPWGKWKPVAWPHDGLQHDKGSGEQLAAQYRDQGLNMLAERATFEDGTNGVEAGVSEMLERMQTGRLRIASNLTDVFDEIRMYHRENGKLVKLMDDLLCAIRYGLMMLRFAAVNKPADVSALENFTVAY